MFNPTPAKWRTSPCRSWSRSRTPPRLPRQAHRGWPVAIFQHGYHHPPRGALAMADALPTRASSWCRWTYPCMASCRVTHVRSALLRADAAAVHCATERTFDVEPREQYDGCGAGRWQGRPVRRAHDQPHEPGHRPRQPGARPRRPDPAHEISAGPCHRAGHARPAGPIGVDPTRISFVGHSLGGSSAARTSTSSTTCVPRHLVFPAGVLSKWAQESQAFGPRVRAALTTQLVFDSYNYKPVLP